jgi:hypothetical protein
MNATYNQRIIPSTQHTINASYHQRNIQSTHHTINATYNQRIIPSTQHTINACNLKQQPCDWSYLYSICIVFIQYTVYYGGPSYKYYLSPLLHMRAALSANSKGTQSVYSRKNPKSILMYKMWCLWRRCSREFIYTVYSV